MKLLFFKLGNNTQIFKIKYYQSTKIKESIIQVILIKYYSITIFFIFLLLFINVYCLNKICINNTHLLQFNSINKYIFKTNDYYDLLYI